MFRSFYGYLVLLPHLVSAELPAWNKRCLPDVNSKRVALLLRGHSYAELGRMSQEAGHDDQFQNDIIENYRENIIDAFCESKIVVDVFIATASTKFTDDLLQVTTPKVASVHNMEEEGIEGGYFSSQVKTYLHLLKSVFEPYRETQNVEYEYIIAARFDTPLKDRLTYYMARSSEFKPNGFNFPFKETFPDWQRVGKPIDFWWKSTQPECGECDHRVGDMFHVWHPRHTPTWISLLESIAHYDTVSKGHMHMHYAYTNMTSRMPDGSESLGFLLPGYYSSVATEPGWYTACFNPLYRVLPRDVELEGVSQLPNSCLHATDFQWDPDLKSYWCKWQNCGAKAEPQLLTVHSEAHSGPRQKQPIGHVNAHTLRGRRDHG